MRVCACVCVRQARTYCVVATDAAPRPAYPAGRESQAPDKPYTHRQTEKQTDRQTDKQTNKQADMCTRRPLPTCALDPCEVSCANFRCESNNGN